MKSNAPKSPDRATLAWAGWRMRIPADWRPLEISGRSEKGRMIVGDGAAAVLQVKWAHPADSKSKKFDPRKWAFRRTGSTGFQPVTGSTGWKPVPPSPPGFLVLGWQPEAKSRRVRKAETNAPRSMWHGWSAKANLLIEVVGLVRDGMRFASTIRDDVLPSLRATPPDAPVDWSVFQVSFRVPPRFDLVERRFHPGHMAMLFRARGERLVLRQAYPRAAALGRRDLAGWLRSEPFVQRKRFYPAGDAEPWSVESGGRELAGLIRFGRRRLPAPLGWVGPLWTVRAIVADERLDRLLLAEHESRREVDEALVAESIATMNRAVMDDGP